MTDKPTTSFAGLGFFTGIAQHENFCQMATLLPSTTLAPSSDPYVWPTSDTIALPEKYEFGGATKSFEDFFVETDTAALLVLVDGAIRHERYALTGGPDVPWISMSVAKSFISTLVGIAVEEGHIKSIDDPISDYVPVNPGSAYDGVPIKQVLLMSSGARWNEDYNDSEADVLPPRRSHGCRRFPRRVRRQCSAPGDAGNALPLQLRRHPGTGRAAGEVDQALDHRLHAGKAV